MKFKNLRRPIRSKRAGITVSPEHVVKRLKVDDTGDSLSDDQTVYQRHVDFLLKSFNSKKWSLSSMVVLLQETAQQRRNWILTDRPHVKEVFNKFPCLTDPEIVSEFYMPLSTLMYICMFFL